MVVTVAWVQSWAVVLISVSALVIVILLLLFCVCWDDGNKSDHQLYILDENGMKIIPEVGDEETERESNGFFRRLSSAALNANFGNLGKFKPNSPDLLQKYNNCNESSRDLMDSVDIDRRFDKTTLQIDCSKTISVPGKLEFELDDEDDACSNKSGVSRNSFYSVYPSYIRQTSAAETMKSALSYSELDV